MMRQRINRLLLLGLLLLLPAPLAAQPPPRFPAPHLIGITPAQQQELTDFFAQADKERREVGGHLHALYQELEDLYDDYVFDKQRALQIRSQIVAQQQKLLALHGDNELKLRKILNPNQFKQLREQMKLWRKTHHRNHGPRPEGGGDERSHDSKGQTG